MKIWSKIKRLYDIYVSLIMPLEKVKKGSKIIFSQFCCGRDASIRPCEANNHKTGKIILKPEILHLAIRKV